MGNTAVDANLPQWFENWITDYDNIAIILALSVLALILAITVYICNGVALTRMAREQELDKVWWFAWIPVLLVDYLTGALAEKESKIKNLGYIMLVISALTWAPIPFYFVISYASYMYVHYFIFKRYSAKYKIMTVFNVITIGLAGAFMLIAISNNKPRNEEKPVI